MTAATPRRSGEPPGPSTAARFAEACAWVADAHSCGDAAQVVAALTHLYELLLDHGWQPSDRAALVLRMHAAALEAGLTRVLETETAT